MAVIQTIPTPMDWRVSDIDGNNATQIVTLQFNNLRSLVREVQDSADKVLSQFNGELPDFGEIQFDSSFDPYDITTVVEQFFPDTNLDDIFVDLPNRPAINEPDSPGAAPDINTDIGNFTDELVFNDNLIPPVNTFHYSEEAYTSELDDKLVEVLLYLLGNSGQTLGTVVEAALWDRAKDRIADEYETEYNRVNDRWAAAGFEIPSGSHDAALREVTNKRMRALEQANYEITIEQARLALQSFQHAISSGISLEGIKKDFFNKVKDRALQAAAETVRMAIAVYAAVVEYNRLYLEKYRTQSEVFNLQQQLILAKATAQLELYRTEVQVFATQWQAEKTKIEAYATAVQAEGVRVGAISEKNKDELQKLSFQLSSHDSWQKNKLALEEIKTRLHASNVEQEGNLARLSIAAQDSNIRNAIEKTNIIRRQLEVAGQLYTQQLASLLSAFNISASMSDSENTNESLSHSYAHQDSVSASVSEQYNYSE